MTSATNIFGRPKTPPNPADVPLPALIVAGFAVTLTILAAAFGGSPTQLPTANLVTARTLRFDDAPNGAVIVTDTDTNKRVAVLAPGSNGFIRASLRGLAHAGSHENQAAANHPFHISAWSDGRLTLDDPTDRRRIDLEAFGETNYASYAALLTAPEAK
jgi:putative photosynthetic complex assembly protein